MKRAEYLSTDLKKRKQSKDLQVMQPFMSVTASRKLIEEKGLQLSDDSDSDYESDFNVVKKDDEFKPVKGQPGMFYKVTIKSFFSIFIFKKKCSSDMIL